MKRLIILIFAAFIGMQFSFAQTSITGKVTSVKDGQPISGAIVTAKVSRYIADTTDALGKYCIKVPKDATVLEANRAGYTMKTVNIGENKVIDFVMTPIQQNLGKPIPKAKPAMHMVPMAKPEKSIK